MFQTFTRSLDVQETYEICRGYSETLRPTRQDVMQGGPAVTACGCVCVCVCVIGAFMRDVPARPSALALNAEQ